MKKNSFSAKISKYGFYNPTQLVAEGTAFSNNPRDEKAIMENKEYYNKNIINLDEITLENLTMYLTNSLEKKQPVFLWSKNREIEKIKLDNDRQLLLKSRLEGLKDLGEGLMELRSDALINKQMILMLSKKNLKQAEVEFDRIVEKSKTEFSYYQRKIEENRLSYERLEIDNKLKDGQGKAEIDIKQAKVEMYRLVKEKLRNGSIKDIPVETLHEIFNFYAEESKNDLEAIARYNKTLSDIDKNQAESYKTFAEGKSKMSDSEGKEFETYMKYYNHKDQLMNNP